MRVSLRVFGQELFTLELGRTADEQYIVLDSEDELADDDADEVVAVDRLGYGFGQ